MTSFRYDKLTKGKKINWMKAGMQECDLLLTVSPYYAEELRSVDECSYQLGTFIKSKQPAIKGIINGVDVDKWNPAFDKFISANYDALTVSSSSSHN
jgi:granule-bound starch synthase